MSLYFILAPHSNIMSVLTAVTFSWCTNKMCNSISKLIDNVTNYLQIAFKQFIFVDSLQKLLCKVINWKNFWFLLFCLLMIYEVGAMRVFLDISWYLGILIASDWRWLTVKGVTLLNKAIETTQYGLQPRKLVNKYV
jgi:hypothetical protein